SAAASPTPNRGTTNEQAYRHVLQGMNLVNQRTVDADNKALEHFEAAIRLDPHYARAYVGIALVYHGKTGLLGSPRIHSEKGKQAINKALELDKGLGVAYAVRGMFAYSYDWDFVESEKDLNTAIQLDPNNDIVQSAHAFFCVYSGRFDQALKEIDTAQGLAPGTARHERDRGRILYYSRRYDEAIVQLTRSLELRRTPGSIWLSRAYEMKGDYAAAFEAFIHTQNDPQDIEQLRRTFQTAGWHGVKARFIELMFLKEPTVADAKLYQIAVAFAQLGKKDEAFAHLDKLAEIRSWQIATISVDPQIDALRGDPRFDKLLGLVRR
ncbi:MAG TPA: tetratricopeptide repeat protein, partial [Pyrinomonadaceae bacterium]|nr:tetratricopeptide repeat protein [Pyrinomonadaceae bacterium]